MIRYIHQELLAKKAINASSIPTYVVNWVFGDDSKSMYDEDQRELYPLSHREKAGWYIECQDGFVPAFQKTLHASLCQETPLEINYIIIEPKGKGREKGKAKDKVKEKEADKGNDGKVGRASKSSKEPKSMLVPKDKPTKSLGTPASTQASQSTTTTRSASKAAAKTPVAPDATEVGSPSNPPIPKPSHSQTVSTEVALACKREAVEKTTTATSSETSSTRFLIENVDMAALMDHYNKTNERHEVYKRIEDFLLEV